MREGMTKCQNFVMSNNKPFPEYLKDRLDQRIKICQKKLREAEQKRDLTEYIRMEAKIDAYSDIWSFLENKDNLTTKPRQPGRLEDDPIISECMEEMAEQMKIQADQLAKLYYKNKEK